MGPTETYAVYVVHAVWICGIIFCLGYALFGGKSNAPILSYREDITAKNIKRLKELAELERTERMTGADKRTNDR